MTDMGYMIRIEGKDADAIGEEVPQAASAEEQAGKSVEDLAWDQLRTCYDPEIPVNIVDLGLVYACEVTPRPEGGHKATVRFTLTAPGCGMGDVLVQDIKQKLEIIPTVAMANVELVFDPPWNQSMMSEAARLQTGMF
jgi:probable FeS assembly SUF system protein SufT